MMTSRWPRKWIAFVLIVTVAEAWIWVTRQTTEPELQPAESSPVNSSPSLAEQRLRVAEKKLKARPSDPDVYAELTTAYMEKARESGDAAFYGRAEAACNKALELNPKSYAAIRLRSWVYSGQHRFREALTAARQALAIDPKDPWNYGTLVDALIELGRYQEGAEAIQRMVDLRPDSAAYTRASYVRELFGDPAGAIDIMSMAVGAAGSRDREHGAWCRVHLGNLLFNIGRLQEAESQYQAALQVFPDYHFALSGLGRIRAAQKQFEEAIRLYQKSIDLVPTHEAVLALADLYVHLNRSQEAERQFGLIEMLEKISRANGVKPESQLVVFYADHGMKLEEALQIARQNASERQDIRTLDALAWVLFKHGRHKEALTASLCARRLGTKDASILYHYGMIESQLGARKEAAEALQQALNLNPYFHPRHAEEARMALEPMVAKAPVELSVPGTGCDAAAARTRLDWVALLDCSAGSKTGKCFPSPRVSPAPGVRRGRGQSPSVAE
jgi:tetratricopeptide (TPR) repeat protein